MKRFLIGVLDFLNALGLLILTAAWFRVASTIVDVGAFVGMLSDTPHFFFIAIFIAAIALPIILLTYFHYLFFGTRNSKFPWLATKASWDEGTWQWSAAFTATLLVVTLMAILAVFYAFSSQIYLLENLQPNDGVMIGFTLLWLFIAQWVLKSEVAPSGRTKMKRSKALD